MTGTGVHPFQVSQSVTVRLLLGAVIFSCITEGLRIDTVRDSALRPWKEFLNTLLF